MKNRKMFPLVILLTLAIMLMIVGFLKRSANTTLYVPTTSLERVSTSSSRGTTVISHSKWTGVHSIPAGRRIEWRQRSANIIYQTRIDYDDRLIFTHYPGRPDLELPETTKAMEWRIPDEERAMTEIVDWEFVDRK